MTNVLRHIITIVLTVLLFGKTYAQDTTTTNFFDQIKTYDLSTVLTADSILAEDREDGKDKIKRAEILGFIGTDFQRFQIHFTSITKNLQKPYEYDAIGKTKVKKIICSFKGKIKITQARLYNTGEIPTYRQGFATCEVILYEDTSQNYSGLIKGRLRSDFLIDNKGRFRYDALMFVADGYSNNEFVGTWTSYKTKTIKKCNWGDYRIPGCEWKNGCDVGAGEFSINEKYLKNGWENYKLADSYDPEKPESQKARQKEDEQWWK